MISSLEINTFVSFILWAFLKDSLDKIILCQFGSTSQHNLLLYLKNGDLCVNYCRPSQKCQNLSLGFMTSCLFLAPSCV